MAKLWSALKAKGRGLFGTFSSNEPILTDGITTVVGGIPTGLIFSYGGGTRPAGFLICDGAAYSRTLYENLYLVLGTTYGVGDGSTTFNVPDLRGRSVVGAGQGATAEGGGTGTSRARGDVGGTETHTLTQAQMPAHTHNYDKTTFQADATISLLGSGNRVTGFTATASTSAGSGAAHNNMHPYGVCAYVIRY